jgi:DUF1707 SHOCT-like domain/Cell wall-active antibiotics response LiaF, C-terminal
VSSSDHPVPQPATPAAREQAVEVLTRHFANDELSEGELEARLQRVYNAVTSQELAEIIADLPAQKASVPIRREDAQRVQIKALFSGQERAIASLVPRALKVRARLGYIELDLTRGTFQPGTTTIDVRAFMGYVQIRFPANVQVENEGSALFGFFSHRAPGGPPPDHSDAQCVVRVTGKAVFGFAETFQSSS